MSEVIFFSLISLVSAGCLDVVYKRSAQHYQSRGVLFFVGGITWITLQIFLNQLDDQPFECDYLTVTFGVITGILAVIANIALVVGLTQLDVSLGSTIYRLNTIGVVILSYLFLNEDLGLLKLTGIGLGIASILVIYNIPKNVSSVTYLKFSIIILIFASLMRAIFGVILKQAVNLGADSDTIMVFFAGSWIVGGIIYYIVREWSAPISIKQVSNGLIAGSLLMIVANSLIEALKYGDVSIVASIANLSFVITLIISIVLGMENITRRKFLAIALATGSILLLAQVTR